MQDYASMNVMKMLKDEIDIELAKCLLEKVENENYPMPCTYKDIAIELEKRLGRPVNAHFNLTRPLGNILELCFELNLPLITALVRRDTKGKTQGAGEGFYTLASELKPQYKNMTSFEAWKKELSLIRECKDWTKLRKYLSDL